MPTVEAVAANNNVLANTCQYVYILKYKIAHTLRGGYPMDMGRNKKQIGLAIDAELLARFEAWQSRQRFAPSRTEVIETLLSDFLDTEETKEVISNKTEP